MGTPLMNISDRPDISAAAGLLADRSRAAVLMALYDGRALPAGQLAVEAGVAASTVSGHLRQLVDAGFLDVEVSGRHRYYRLARAEVGDLLEALVALSPEPVQPRSMRSAGRPTSKGLRYFSTAGWIRSARWVKVAQP